MHIPAPAPAATTDDHASVVEMARHACIIEDWPLPDPDDDEVLEMLPPPGVIPIIAEDRSELPVGAALPELCIGVAPGRRGGGVGGLLLDALFADLSPHVEMMCANVHLRNPAKRLYERKGYREVGQGNGPLGLAMIKYLR